MSPGKPGVALKVELLQEYADVLRRVRLDLLSKPPAHRVRPDPDPRYYRTLPVEVEKSALKFEATRRLKLLSQVPNGKFTDKYVPPVHPEHYVQKHNLSYVASHRIEELSKPRSLFKKFKKRLKHFKKKAFQKSMAGKKKDKGKKAIKVSTSREDWLALRAAPRKVPPPPPIPKWERKTKPLSPEERERRIAEIAIPSPRYLYKPAPWDPYEVSKAARKARATKHIAELAAPRELPPEAQLDLAFQPFTIKKGALKYKASKRTKELAEPVVKRKAVDMDVREDAFTVPKRALKAKCSKRTKELAKPIVRRGVD